MTDLLVRDIPDDLKQKLAIRAAENGRSQSAEVLSILEETLQPELEKSLFEKLRELSEYGGLEIERPTWKSQDFSFDLS